MHETKSSPQEEQVSDAKSWDEIGDKFRLVMYDLIHRFRQETQKKESLTSPGYQNEISSLLLRVLHRSGAQAYKDSDAR